VGRRRAPRRSQGTGHSQRLIGPAKVRMRLLLLGLVLATAVAIVTVVTVLPITSPAATRPVPGTWTTVFADTFRGTAGSGIDTQYWKYDTGQGVFGNGEVETMTDSRANVYLDGRGDLDITALDQAGWTSGRVQTVSSTFAAPKDGEVKVSASIEQPDGTGSTGLGYWPAFWLLGPGTWPEHGEIDVLEDVNLRSMHSGALHCGNLTTPEPGGTLGPCHEFIGISSGLRPCPGCQTGFHVYSVVIDRRDEADQQIRWYLDGREFFAVSESRVGAAVWGEAVDHGFSIIFDLAIGGTYPDNTCGCKAPTAQTGSGGTMRIRDVSVAVWRPATSR
jgi:beta-glucanase (GH16 family)